MIQNIFVFQNADYYILKPDILNVNLQYFSAQRINLWLTGSLVYEYVKSGATYALKTTSSITAGHVFTPLTLCNDMLLTEITQRNITECKKGR